MALFNRAQQLAWESSVRLAAEALADPKQRPTRLRARLRSAAVGLQECLTTLLRAVETVETAERYTSRCDARFSGLVEMLPIPYLVTDRAGTIVAVNDAAAAALNLSARALLGRNLLLFLDDREGWLRLLAHIDESPAICDGRLRPRERVRAPICATLSVADADGSSVQWLLTGAPRDASNVAPPRAATA